MKFTLFDAVELTESATLAEGQMALAGTRGAIVEVLDHGEAYLVELFGKWVRRDRAGHLIAAQPEEAAAFMETLGVALLTSTQLRLRQPADQTVGERTRLLSVVEGLPESLVKEVADFAEFLQQKAVQQTVDESAAYKTHA
jgi:hypothetical protein